MTLTYQVIMEKYSFSNGVVGGSTPAMKSSLYLTEKETTTVVRSVGSQEPTHRKVGSKPHLVPRGFLSRVGPTGSKSRWIARRWLFINLRGAKSIVGRQKR